MTKTCFYTGFANYSAKEMCFHLLNPGDDGENIIAADSIECECEWYQSLTAHQHQKGHTVPKQA